MEFETQGLAESGPISLKVVVTVDGNQFSNNNLIFNYDEDPTIMKVEPAVVLQRYRKVCRPFSQPHIFSDMYIITIMRKIS